MQYKATDAQLDNVANWKARKHLKSKISEKLSKESK